VSLTQAPQPERASLTLPHAALVQANRLPSRGSEEAFLTPPTAPQASHVPLFTPRRAFVRSLTPLPFPAEGRDGGYGARVLHGRLIRCPACVRRTKAALSAGNVPGDDGDGSNVSSSAPLPLAARGAPPSGARRCARTKTAAAAAAPDAVCAAVGVRAVRGRGFGPTRAAGTGARPASRAPRPQTLRRRAPGRRICL